MNPLSALYGTLARARRARYARHPQRRRRLPVPVISIGNLTVGGSGKTPVVAAVARLLRDAGERPAIVSRGYRRRDRSTAPVIASDASRVRVDVATSGDEPQMLARALPGVPMIVCADRYAGGRVAAEQMGATVLVLDDGFQHLGVWRDVDLLVVSEGDLRETPLPFGRLREPLDAARAAHAVIVPGGDDAARKVSAAVGVEPAFHAAVAYDAPRRVTPFGDPLPDASPRRVVAVTGIARPERVFTALRAQGWDVVREWTFRDHYWFTASDVSRIDASMRDAGASLVMTTEKDAVRLEPLLGSRAAWAYLPMRVAIEPDAAFRGWLAARLAEARGAGGRRA